LSRGGSSMRFGRLLGSGGRYAHTHEKSESQAKARRDMENSHAHSRILPRQGSEYEMGAAPRRFTSESEGLVDEP
jgi:hypothetical protein